MSSGKPVLELLKLQRSDFPAAWWKAQWIWCRDDDGPANTDVWFQREFELPAAPEEAEVLICADDRFEIFINGKWLGSGDNWQQTKHYNVGALLQSGHNKITVRVRNDAAWGGLLCELYYFVNGKSQRIITDGNWKCHIGGSDMPEKFPLTALSRGTPPVYPWGMNVEYHYIGRAGMLEILDVGQNSFKAKVLRPCEIGSDTLDFLLEMPGGKTLQTWGRITPSTAQWQAGQTLDIHYAIPDEYISQAAAIRIKPGIVIVKNNQSVGTKQPVAPGARQLAEVHLENAGIRPFIVMNGKKLPPFYYYPGVGRNNVPGDWRKKIADGVKCDTPFMMLDVSYDRLWPKAGVLDFTFLDRMLATYSVIAKDIPFILHINTGMPNWWCRNNPDEVVKFDSGQPINDIQDRQSLASKKWLEDGGETLRQIIRHLKTLPVCGQIIGISISEGWNSEWFWPYKDLGLSGYSVADYKTFRGYLKEKYKSDDALAQAWKKPGITFETFTMPSVNQINAASAITLLDPEKDQMLIDYFSFRNRAIGDALEHFGKIVKQESNGKWLVSCYYGYFTVFTNIWNRLQTVGHLDIERLVRSPYFDMCYAPSHYIRRYPGDSDEVMQAAATVTSHGKLVIVEQDMRTYWEQGEREVGNGRANSVRECIGMMDRAFGLALSRGIGTHWYNMYDGWFREEVFYDVLKSYTDTYRQLPPVQNYTPVEVTLVSDVASALYAKHNNNDGSHRATVYETVRAMTTQNVAWRHVFVSDLRDRKVPPSKFYIMTNMIMLSDADRKMLMERFASEKATVLWLWTAGVTRPDSGPDSRFMEDLLGIKFKTVSERLSPSVTFIPSLNVPGYTNYITSGPWFVPERGFDTVLGTLADGSPAFVQKQINGASHYFLTLMNPSVELLNELFKRAGVFRYAAPDDPVAAGNDVIFLHARTSGEKRIMLRPGLRLRAIAGPHSGVRKSGEAWQAVAGNTYGFLVEKIKE